MLSTYSEPTQRYDSLMENSEASKSLAMHDYEALKYLLRGLMVIRLPIIMLV